MSKHVSHDENGKVIIVDGPTLGGVPIEQAGTHSIMNRITRDLSGGSIVDQLNKKSEDPHSAAIISDMVPEFIPEEEETTLGGE